METKLGVDTAFGTGGGQFDDGSGGSDEEDDFRER